MKTIDKIKAKGYKVIFDTNGRTVFAEKNNRRTSAPNITQLYNKLKN